MSAVPPTPRSTSPFAEDVYLAPIFEVRVNSLFSLADLKDVLEKYLSQAEEVLKAVKESDEALPYFSKVCEELRETIAQIGKELADPKLKRRDPQAELQIWKEKTKAAHENDAGALSLDIPLITVRRV